MVSFEAFLAMESSNAPPLFSKRKSKKVSSNSSSKEHNVTVPVSVKEDSKPVEEITSFQGLGLTDWLVRSCKELGMKRPTPVQQGCVPQILAGKDVFGLAQTGSGKTAAFALPILQKLAENPYGVFALVLTPTRELAFQIADQFKALGAEINLRSTVVVGGMDMTEQAKALMQRPHVVIATPGRLRDHLINDPGIPSVFARAKFLVLDEADRLMDVGFESELRAVFQGMPDTRQTLLFSATMTTNLKALHDVSLDKAFFYQAYEGFKTVEALQQHYILTPANVKDVYLMHIMSTLEERKIRSVIIFASSCRTCHLLSLMMAELEVDTTALHSMKTQQQRLASLSRFKSGQVPILIATDVASRGLDIPTVDLVVNYDIPRFTRDYVHRVGRTARAGRGGSAVSLITQYDVELVHDIEDLLGKKLEEYEVEEDKVLKTITKVYKAKRVAMLKIVDSGFEEKVKTRKDQKVKSLVDKGLLDPNRLKERKRKKPENRDS